MCHRAVTTKVDTNLQIQYLYSQIFKFLNKLLKVDPGSTLGRLWVDLGLLKRICCHIITSIQIYWRYTGKPRKWARQRNMMLLTCAIELYLLEWISICKSNICTPNFTNSWMSFTMSRSTNVGFADRYPFEYVQLYSTC